jgi:hypothetical protein
VCGIPLDEARRAAIRERASKYLASDDVAILNAMKGDVTTYVGTMPDDHEESLRSRAREVRSAMADVGSLRTEKSQLESDAIAGSPELEQAKARIAALESDHREAREALRKYDDPSDAAGDKDTWGLAVLKRRLEDAENKLAEITRTRVMKAKRDTLKLIFEQAHARSRRKLADQIRDDANDRMGKLMPSNLIRIERIDRCLVLSGQEGGSVGETLAVGYSFLATLFSRTDHQLPFIVDSPANSIDLAVRARVAELVPRLAEQFIAFTISSERQGFLESLERTATDGIQYVTVFRRGTPDLDGLAERAGEHVETTTDGMCVSGREFFRRFHLDEDIA